MTKQCLLMTYSLASPAGMFFNSLWPSDVIWRQGSMSISDQVMACCLAAPSHYLNQSWLMISEALWHSPDSNFTENTSYLSSKWVSNLLILYCSEILQGPMSQEYRDHSGHERSQLYPRISLAPQKIVAFNQLCFLVMANDLKWKYVLVFPQNNSATNSLKLFSWVSLLQTTIRLITGIMTMLRHRKFPSWANTQVPHRISSQRGGFFGSRKFNLF